MAKMAGKYKPHREIYGHMWNKQRGNKLFRNFPHFHRNIVRRVHKWLSARGKEKLYGNSNKYPYIVKSPLLTFPEWTKRICAKKDLYRTQVFQSNFSAQVISNLFHFRTTFSIKLSQDCNRTNFSGQTEKIILNCGFSTRQCITAITYVGNSLRNRVNVVTGLECRNSRYYLHTGSFSENQRKKLPTVYEVI